MTFTERGKNGADIFFIPISINHLFNRVKLVIMVRKWGITRYSARLTPPPSISELIICVVEVHIESILGRRSNTNLDCSLQDYNRPFNRLSSLSKIKMIHTPFVLQLSAHQNQSTAWTDSTQPQGHFPPNHPSRYKLSEQVLKSCSYLHRSWQCKGPILSHPNPMSTSTTALMRTNRTESMGAVISFWQIREKRVEIWLKLSDFRIISRTPIRLSCESRLFNYISSPLPIITSSSRSSVSIGLSSPAVSFNSVSIISSCCMGEKSESQILAGKLFGCIFGSYAEKHNSLLNALSPSIRIRNTTWKWVL